MPSFLSIPKEISDQRQLVETVLQQAKKIGATQAEVTVGISAGFSTTVRMGEVETLEHQQDKSIGITIYLGKKRGTATLTDTRPEALEQAVQKAYRIAEWTEEDPCAGLAEASLLAKSFPDLELYHPWLITPKDAIEKAIQCEALARKFDPRITNSEGVSIATHESMQCYGNSHGFYGFYPSVSHYISCALVGSDARGMQRDSAYTCSRDPNDLASIEWVARDSAEKTVKRLGARRLPTCEVPVIFQAEVARSLIGDFLGAISGGNLYRKASCLVDHLGKLIFPAQLNIEDNPFLLKGWGSSAFDAEGVATQKRFLVKEGILQGYLLGSYSGRKLGMQTTGNAGGSHNVCISTGDLDLPALLKKMDKGLLVTELFGQGVNLVTGDYSRGIYGFWVERGEIQYPVEEITIAGNLKEIWKNIMAVGNDVDTRSAILTGSILVEKMMIGGV